MIDKDKLRTGILSAIKVLECAGAEVTVAKVSRVINKSTNSVRNEMICMAENGIVIREKLPNNTIVWRLKKAE